MSTTTAAPASTDPRADLPDSLRPITAMHDAMRRDARRFRAALDRRPDTETAERLRVWFERITGVIVHHHRCEDEILWPAIEQWVPDFVETAGHLVDDHHALDIALADVDRTLGRLANRDGDGPTDADHQAASDALAAFEDVLDRHLTAEEATVLPAIRDVVPAEAFARTEEEINRTGTFGLAAFALPWVLDDADPRSAELILGGLPLPFRLLHRWVWARRYARASMLG